MKYKFTFLLFFSFCYMLFAQNGMVNGRIIDHNNAPVVGVNTYILENTALGSLTDTDGRFVINNIPSGNHTLVVSSIGYKTLELDFNIDGTKTIQFGDILLHEGNELLQKVSITYRKNNFSRKKTAYVSKLPLKDLENAHTYSTVTSDLLNSQMTLNFDDALKNATGVDKRWEATGRSGDGTGYYSIRGFSAQPGMIDGVPGYTFSALDPSYVERIEVLKGPSATLFGSTVPSLGGLINVVTKKPFEGFGGSVGYTIGSFDTHLVSLDLNTPISKDNGLYFRLNGSYLTQGSFQNAGFRKSYFLAPSVSYRVNNRLSLSLGVEYAKSRQTNPAMIFVRRGYPMPTNNIKDFGLDSKESFTNDYIYLDNPTLTTRGIANYKISKNWTSQTILASSRSSSKGFYQYMIEGAGVYFLNPDPKTPQEVAQNQFIQGFLAQDVLSRILDKRNAFNTTFNVQQNFIGDFNLGSLRNRLVFGLDYVNAKSENKNRAVSSVTGFPVVYGFFKPDGTPVDDIFFTPTQVETEYPINQSVLNTLFDAYQVAENDIKTKSQTFAAYISDVINITPSLSAMIGLRADYFDQKGNIAIKEDDYTKLTLSPKFGIVYQPILKQLSLFANYQTGFINTNPEVAVVDGNVVVQNFEPQRAKQFEIGTKTNLWDQKLNLGLSYYNITVNDRNTLDPSSPLSSITLDEIKSQGVEFELNVNPINGLNLRSSVAYNDSKITKTEYSTLKDTRPSEAGPAVIYNLWADYKFIGNSALKGLGFGIGFDGTSNYFTMDNKVSGKFELPSYTLLNAAVYYDHKRFRVGAKFNNITNQQYYKGWGTINPQAPRSILGNVVYKF